jgi:hypothetical protein
VTFDDDDMQPLKLQVSGAAGLPAVFEYFGFDVVAVTSRGFHKLCTTSRQSKQMMNVERFKMKIPLQWQLLAQF